MTDKKRYQVFVSSTYADLVQERQAVTSALLQLDAFPSGMELFPVADDDAWTLITRVIDDCEYYLLVIGVRYGSEDPIERLSFTEKEYDYATQKGKPVMAFLHGDPDSIPVGKTDKDSEASKKLQAFREKVQAAKHVKYWTSPEQLAGQVALSFAQFTNQYPAVGWIRADRAASWEALQEIDVLRKKLAAAQEDLETARHEPPPGTSGAETVTVYMSLTAEARQANKASRRITTSIAVKPTWDELFAAAGVSLIDECEEGVLGQQLANWLYNYKLDIEEIRSHLNAEAAKRDFEAKQVTFYGVEAELDEEDFGTIRVQFIALGLMRRSDRKRSVSDKGTYWTVTPYGETKVIQLRAIKGAPKD